MRIVIDATPLLLRSAGVKTLVYHWIRSLNRLDGEDSIRLFPLLKDPGECPHERSVLPLPQTLWRLGLLHIANHVSLDALNWLGPRADVFHASHQCWSPPRSARVTTSIYDMTCWVVPEMHTSANVTGAKLFAQRVIRRADGLIAISDSAKRDAVRLLGLAEHKIEVIHPGIAEPYFQTSSSEVCAATREFGLGRPYILSVGTIEPRKNLDVLLDAYHQLPEDLRGEFDLVVAGPAGWAAAHTLARLRAGAPGVRYLGYVPEQDLPGLTAGASVFVYPSLYEGFGLPVAQAMAAGVPVITSNVSSLPEVCGEAGLLIDPRSPSEVRDAITRLLLSRETRDELRNKGLARARRFTWDEYARKSLRFFHRVCGLE